jgi:predicted nucleic acid-binding protein
MTAVLVDSNVLIDVISNDERWFFWSADALECVANCYRHVINPIVCAEVSVRVSRIEDVEAALPATMFNREANPLDAAFLAGKAFLTYRQREGVKRSPLPDFFIGAHAAVADYTLLTRDVARYRTYFPRLSLIAPDDIDFACSLSLLL